MECNQCQYIQGDIESYFSLLLITVYESLEIFYNL